MTTPRKKAAPKKPKIWQPEAAGIVSPQGYEWWGDVDQAAVDWAWPGMIPLGALTLLMGPPGVTKSSLMAWVAAEFSNGRLEGDCKGEKAGVLWLSFEDSSRINIAPKLAVAKAGPKVLLIDEDDPAANINVTSPAGVKNLEAIVRGYGIKMVIVDPLMAFTSSRFSQHTNTAAVIQMLSPLAQLCAVENIAVIGIAHTGRGKTKAEIDSISGSQGFASTSRHVLVVGRKGPNYLVAPIKSNLARTGYGHTYSVEYVEAGESTNKSTGKTKVITASKVTMLRPCIPHEVEQCLKDESLPTVSPYVRPILEALNTADPPAMDTTVLHQRLVAADVFDIKLRQFTNILAELRDLGYVAEDYNGYGKDFGRFVWITASGRAFINDEDDDTSSWRGRARTESIIFDQDDDD